MACISHTYWSRKRNEATKLLGLLQEKRPGTSLCGVSGSLRCRCQAAWSTIDSMQQVCRSCTVRGLRLRYVSAYEQSCFVISGEQLPGACSSKLRAVAECSLHVHQSPPGFTHHLTIRSSWCGDIEHIALHFEGKANFRSSAEAHSGSPALPPAPNRQFYVVIVSRETSRTLTTVAARVTYSRIYRPSPEPSGQANPAESDL